MESWGIPVYGRRKEDHSPSYKLSNYLVTHLAMEQRGNAEPVRLFFPKKPARCCGPPMIRCIATKHQCSGDTREVGMERCCFFIAVNSSTERP